MADEPKQPESPQTPSTDPKSVEPEKLEAAKPEEAADAATASPRSKAQEMHRSARGKREPRLTASPDDPLALPADPEFDEEPLETLISALRGMSSGEMILRGDDFLEEVAGPEERSETPERLTRLPEDREIPPDPGLPIPDEYDIDMISALVQDPFRIYAYWEVRRETIASLETLFTPEELDTFRPVLRVTEKQTGTENLYPVVYPGAEWLSVSPDRTYVVEFGVYSPDFGFVRLMSAPEVSTPRGTVAPEVAPEPEFQVNTNLFKHVLTAAGFNGQAEPLPQETLRDWLPPTTVEAFVAAGEGQPLDRGALSGVPDTIRDILAQLIESDDGEMAAMALLHYLPSVLRDAYLAEMAARGRRVGVLNIAELDSRGIEAGEDFDEDLGFEEFEDEEEFFVPGLFRFGTGSSAGSELGSMSRRRRRRLPRRRPRPQFAERPTPWLPSMDRPASSGGRALVLPMDFDLLFGN